ncbi:mitochondrial import inner membrane translocase subunit TIM22 (TIM22) [Vairimorpha necatrix]|uniref:Mitochondrial import inner membrane translocase subunit TIM22 n=1 Tax=Vairimorpha necatrix TaxID=6039 RepID=A0AAX4JB36_9MICR
MNCLKDKVKLIKPKILKTVSSTLQGYLFGCMIGMFTGSDKPTIRSIHNSGQNVAKVCLVYSATEIALETVREKNDFYTKLTSGAITGGICSKGKLVSKNTVFGALGLGMYSGLIK